MGFDRRMCAHGARTIVYLRHMTDTYRIPAHAYCREIESEYYRMRLWMGGRLE